MAQKLLLGRRNLLKVQRILDHGLYLEGGEIGDILLPKRYIPEGTKVGDELDVFLYLDQEERLIATTEHPLVQVGEFAYLECTWTNEYGAYLNWGLMKDLFCPFREQKVRMQRGQRYQIYCYIDDLTYRIVCSSKIEKFMQGRENVSLFADRLLRYIQNQPDQFCRFHDKSPSEEIYAEFGVSKKIFKQAVGELYKKQAIVIEEGGLRARITYFSDR